LGYDKAEITTAINRLVMTVIFLQAKSRDGHFRLPLRRRKLFELFVGFRLWHLVSLRLLRAALAQQDVPKSLQTKTTGATVVFT